MHTGPTVSPARLSSIRTQPTGPTRLQSESVIAQPCSIHPKYKTSFTRPQQSGDDSSVPEYILVVIDRDQETETKRVDSVIQL